MAVEFASSADKHGVPREDALYAISHARASQVIDSRVARPGETVRIYVGPQHAQTDRLLEVIVAERPPRTVVIFHVMELSDLWRPLIEGEDG